VRRSNLLRSLIRRWRRLTLWLRRVLDDDRIRRNQAFKKNDVLPPWIESRKQHTAALETLHTSLTSMLHRRLLIHPDLPRWASVSQIERLRVREIEPGGSEHAFWLDMVKDVNSKGRSADGIGPPSTRKG
jgi:hypothetical protein